jgi:hypothetical protein
MYIGTLTLNRQGNGWCDVLYLGGSFNLVELQLTIIDIFYDFCTTMNDVLPTEKTEGLSAIESFRDFVKKQDDNPLPLHKFMEMFEDLRNSKAVEALTDDSFGMEIKKC